MDELVQALHLYLSARGAKQALLERMKEEGWEFHPSHLSHILSGRRPLAGHLREAILQALELPHLEEHPSLPLEDYLDLSDRFREKLQKGEWHGAWRLVIGFLPREKASLHKIPSWARVRFVEDALLAVSLACLIDALGPAALFLSWARQEIPRISREGYANYIKQTGSRLDAKLFQRMLDLSLRGTEATFYHNRRSWRRAYELRGQILAIASKASKLPEPLAAHYRVGAWIGQLLALPRIPRFSIREAIRLIEQIRWELEVKDWSALTEIPGFSTLDIHRFRAESLFYAHRGFLMACARYGGDWIRTGERIAQANMGELNRIQNPLLQCSFLRAYADYRWSLERPDWEGGLEAMKQALEIAEQSSLPSQRRKIAEEIRQAIPHARGRAKILQRFLEEHNLTESFPLFGKE